MTTRSERSHAATLAATRDLLASGGFVGLSVEGIAARAGVGKATIYRHWRSLPELVLDAMQMCVVHAQPPDTGTLRGDLVEVMRRLVAAMTSDAIGSLLPALVDASERDPEMAELQREFTARRRENLKKVLRRAVATGEARQDLDVELAAELLAGPVFYRRLVSRQPLPKAFAERVVNAMLPMLVEAPAATETREGLTGSRL